MMEKIIYLWLGLGMLSMFLTWLRIYRKDKADKSFRSLVLLYIVLGALVGLFGVLVFLITYSKGSMIYIPPNEKVDK